MGYFRKKGGQNGEIRVGSLVAYADTGDDVRVARYVTVSFGSGKAHFAMDRIGTHVGERRLSIGGVL
jgi:hypothetical protein